MFNDARREQVARECRKKAKYVIHIHEFPCWCIWTLCELTEIQIYKEKVQAKVYLKGHMETWNIKQQRICPETNTHKMLMTISLGTLLMALSGRRTLTVRMADRLMFCRSSEYSTILNIQTKKQKGRERSVNHLIMNCHCLDRSLVQPRRKND